MKVAQIPNDHSIIDKSAFKDERCDKPNGLSSKRRMRETEEVVFSTGDMNPMIEDIFEPSAQNPLVGDARIEANRLAIFVAKLDSEEIFVVIWVLSKNPIVGFSLGA